MIKVNSSWRLHISGELIDDPRRPYVVVSNHQSHADIPIISNLPWEMKWLAKVELFRSPLIGWMLRMAGDIPVDRGNRRAAAQAFLTAKSYLQQHCSVMFFPEGTRSPDGRVGAFADGAFQLAIKEQVPILPLVVEGSRNCLPKKSWKFGKPQDISLRVLQPVETAGMTVELTASLRDRVRSLIIAQVAAMRGVETIAADGITTQQLTASTPHS